MKKLKQIVSCDGWVAVIENEPEEFAFIPVACWALAESNEILPIISHEGKMTDATTLDGFVEAISEEMMLNHLDDDDDDED